MSSDEYVNAIVGMKVRVDVTSLTASLLHPVRYSAADRHEFVVRALQETAARTQASLIEELERGLKSGEVEEVTPFWIANMVAVKAKVSLIQSIAKRDDVGGVFADAKLEIMKPVAESPALVADQQKLLHHDAADILVLDDARPALRASMTPSEVRSRVVVEVKATAAMLTDLVEEMRSCRDHGTPHGSEHAKCKAIAVIAPELFLGIAANENWRLFSIDHVEGRVVLGDELPDLGQLKFRAAVTYLLLVRADAPSFRSRSTADCITAGLSSPIRLTPDSSIRRWTCFRVSSQYFDVFPFACRSPMKSVK